MGERRKLKDILETISVVFGSCLAAIIIIVVATTKYDFSQSNENKAVENNVQEDMKPVAQVEVTDEPQAESENSISGDKIVKANCAMCHAGGLMGAPKIGDNDQWAPRIAQGKEILVKNAINGIRMMPAKGGNTKLTDEEVTAAVVVMVNASGGNL